MHLDRWCALMCAAGAAIAAGSSIAAGQTPTRPEVEAHAPPARQSLRIRLDDSGLVRSMMGPDAVTPINDITGQPFTTAEEFLQERGGSFGADDPAKELLLVRTTTDNLGWTTSEYRQVFKGIPVFTGVLKVHQNADGLVMGANGDFHAITRDKLDVTPTLSRRQVEQAARLALGGAENATLAKCELCVVDPGWYGDRPRGARLAWHVEFVDPTTPMHAALFIDADSGALLDAWSMQPHARQRYVFDAENTTEPFLVAARFEGDPPYGIYDVDAAYDYAGDTYDYFLRAFGRDGLDGFGFFMAATVRTTAVPCPNAFWDNYYFQAFFCEGVVTDDIVAHELTHGLTRFTADLIYQNQSGQLNESFSDVFGELVDLFNGDAAFAGAPSGPSWPAHGTGPGNDAPNDPRTSCTFAPGYADGVRWLMGEDSIGFGGPIRDLWAPSCAGDPDHADHFFQYCSPYDAGGVHSGSGVLNHAFALVTDGGAFNEFDVPAIGPIKSGAVWYRALTTYLTVASDFEDAYWALNQAASDLIGTTPLDPRTGLPSGSAFTSADAEAIDIALRAVGLDSIGACGQTIDVLEWEFQPVFDEGVAFFEEDFEGGAIGAGIAGWSVGNSIPFGSGYDWFATTNLPYAREGNACVALNDVGGFDDETGTLWLESPEITIPAGAAFPVLAFDHYAEIEWLWDGGWLELSVNDAPWAPVPFEAFMLNPYNEVLYSPVEGNTNPRAGLDAFSGSGGRWGTSVVNLRPFVSAGSNVRIRFVLGKDICCGLNAWWVDDVRLLDMKSPADCDDSGTPDFVEDPGKDPSILWSRRPAFGIGFRSDENPIFNPQVMATRVHLSGGGRVEKLRLWGAYTQNSPPAPDFTVIIHPIDPISGYYPGAPIYSEAGVSAERELTEFITVTGYDVYEIELTLATPQPLDADAYFVQIRDDTSGDNDAFLWLTGNYNQGLASLAFSTTPLPDVEWILTSLQAQLALELVLTPPGCPVDLDCDADVDVYDFSAFLLAFGATEQDTRYDVNADYDGDGFITIADFSFFAPAFGCGMD